jgi:single-stranded DNA-binding protein
MKISFALEGNTFMQVTLSGRTGRDVKTADVPRHDGSGTFQISETALAVKVNEDTTDWYQLKFKGDALVNAAGYIPKGSPISITGDMTFEHWNDDDGNLKAKPVVTIAEVQLPPKAKAA